MSNLRIYYSGNSYPQNYISCDCSRWQEDNWSIILETVLPSGDRNTIFSNVTPNAYRELYSILGQPHFIDSTYTSSNTLIFEPQSGYGLSSLREKRIVAVRNVSDSFLVPDRFSVKLECIRIDV